MTTKTYPMKYYPDIILFHVLAVENTKTIVQEYFNIFEDFGYMDHVKEIRIRIRYMSIRGLQDVHDILSKYEKVNIVFVGRSGDTSDSNIYSLFYPVIPDGSWPNCRTLGADETLLDFLLNPDSSSDVQDGDVVLFIHTQGITHCIPPELGGGGLHIPFDMADSTWDILENVDGNIEYEMGLVKNTTMIRPVTPRGYNFAIFNSSLRNMQLSIQKVLKFISNNPTIDIFDYGLNSWWNAVNPSIFIHETADVDRFVITERHGLTFLVPLLSKLGHIMFENYVNVHRTPMPLYNEMIDKLFH